jgi:hypothetical protein
MNVMGSGHHVLLVSHVWSLAAGQMYGVTDGWPPLAPPGRNPAVAPANGWSDSLQCVTLSSKRL